MKSEPDVLLRVGLEHGSQLEESGKQVDQPETAYSAPYEIIRQDRTQGGPGVDKVVPVPERGPRDDDQEQPNLDEEGDE